MQTAKVKAAAFVAVIASLGMAAHRVAAAEYELDPPHTSFVFRIQHAGVSNVYGRFNKVEGTLTVDDADASKNAVSLTITTESIDTGNERRDTHLRSDDFFDAKQYQAITFTSTKVEPTDGGWSVTGDLVMHGVTKSITIAVKQAAGEFPPGTKRVGLTSEFPINRKDFGVGVAKFDGALGEQVDVYVGLEATAK